MRCKQKKTLHDRCLLSSPHLPACLPDCWQNGVTCLHWAAFSGNKDLVLLLLSQHEDGACDRGSMMRAKDKDRIIACEEADRVSGPSEPTGHQEGRGRMREGDPPCTEEI
jgi:hypothetical protein